jgi:hypothetical protein
MQRGRVRLADKCHLQDVVVVHQPRGVGDRLFLRQRIARDHQRFRRDAEGEYRAGHTPVDRLGEAFTGPTADFGGYRPQLRDALDSARASAIDWRVSSGESVAWTMGTARLSNKMPASCASST